MSSKKQATITVNQFGEKFQVNMQNIWNSARMLPGQLPTVERVQVLNGDAPDEVDITLGDGQHIHLDHIGVASQLFVVLGQFLAGLDREEQGVNTAPDFSCSLVLLCESCGFPASSHHPLNERDGQLVHDVCPVLRT